MKLEFVDFKGEYQISLSADNRIETDALNSLSDKNNIIESIWLKASCPSRLILRIKRKTENE